MVLITAILLHSFLIGRPQLGVHLGRGSRRLQLGQRLRLLGDGLPLLSDGRFLLRQTGLCFLQLSVLPGQALLQLGHLALVPNHIPQILLRHLKDYGVAPGGRAVLDVPHCEAVPGGQDALPLDLGAVPPDALDLFQGGRLPLKYRTVLPIGRAPQDHPAG